MNPEQLLEYLRYLQRRVEATQSGAHFGIEEFASLQSELSVFRERVSGLNFVSASHRDYLTAVNINIPRGHLSGSREYFFRTWWMRLPYLGLFFRATAEEKDSAIIVAELARLRDRIDDLRCLIALTIKSPTK